MPAHSLQVNRDQYGPCLARLDDDCDLPVFLLFGLRLCLGLLLRLRLLNLRLGRHFNLLGVGVNSALLNKLSTIVASSFTPGARNPKPCGGQHRHADAGVDDERNRLNQVAPFSVVVPARVAASLSVTVPLRCRQTCVLFVSRTPPITTMRAVPNGCPSVALTLLPDTFDAQNGRSHKGSALKVDFSLGGRVGTSYLAAVRYFSQVLLSQVLLDRIFFARPRKFARYSCVFAESVKVFARFHQCSRSSSNVD